MAPRSTEEAKSVYSGTLQDFSDHEEQEFDEQLALVFSFLLANPNYAKLPCRSGWATLGRPDLAPSHEPRQSFRKMSIPARTLSEQPGLGPPQKGVNYHFSSPQFDKPYVVGKLSISRFRMCNFTRIGRQTKKLWLSIIPARTLSDQPGLGPPSKKV